MRDRPLPQNTYLAHYVFQDMKEVIWSFSFVNPYFCTSTNLNPELLLVIFSLSLKLICSLRLAVNMETTVSLQHANTRGQTHQQQVKVLFKGQQPVLHIHAGCADGRRAARAGCQQDLCKRTKKTTFWTSQTAHRKEAFFVFSTEGTTQWVLWTLSSLSLEAFRSESPNQPKVSCREQGIGVGAGGGHACLHTWEGTEVGLIWTFHRWSRFY